VEPGVCPIWIFGKIKIENKKEGHQILIARINIIKNNI
jgi:hypothetical protein